MTDAAPADVPSGIDLRDPADAAAWVADADRKRPWRHDMRHAIAEQARDARRLLELGPGPGLLAEVILSTHEVERYTLLDFSPPMLDLCRRRVGAHPAIDVVLADFTHPAWAASTTPPYDAVVAMQAVHEIRHKRHLPRLYTQLHHLLHPGGLLAVADHTPPDDTARMTSLHATEAEQHAAMASAHLVDITTHLTLHGLYLCTARRPT